MSQSSTPSRGPPSTNIPQGSLDQPLKKNSLRYRDGLGHEYVIEPHDTRYWHIERYAHERWTGTMWIQYTPQHLRPPK